MATLLCYESTAGKYIGLMHEYKPRAGRDAIKDCHG